MRKKLRKVVWSQIVLTLKFRLEECAQYINKMFTGLRTLTQNHTVYVIYNL